MATPYKPTRLIPSEQTIIYWTSIGEFPNDTTTDHLCAPETWAHVARTLKPGAHIIVQPEGLPYEAEMVVIASGATFAKVKLIRCSELNGVIKDLGENIPLVVKWNAGFKKFTVNRAGSNELVKGDFADKEAAETWAREHTAAMAA